MNKTVLYVGAFALLAICQSFARQITPLEENWKFTRQDNPNFACENFDASNWQTVNVPHDWAIRENFDISIDQSLRYKKDASGQITAQITTGRTGALPYIGKGYYRHNFEIAGSDKDKKFFLEFDGAMSHAKVYVNGNFAGEHPYGYASFSLDISNLVKIGKNTVAVSLENKARSSRWYPGAGLYRNVRLVSTNKTYIPYSGIYIKTPKVSPEKSLCEIQVQVKKQTFNQPLTFKAKIFDSENNLVAEKSVSTEKDLANIAIELKNAKLWSADCPNLYTAKICVQENGKDVDCITKRFGFRTVSMTLDGFKINGKKEILKGVCLHHDFGALGAAYSQAAMRYRINMLKEMGCNAIRTSHNIPDPNMLDLCDEMGMYVMDEIFDEWQIAKCPNGYNKDWKSWAKKDIDAFVKRDRSHPSVVLWSIGNEIRDQMTLEIGAKNSKFLTESVKALDNTRPVTAGLHPNYRLAENVYGKYCQVHDLVGYNYKPNLYKETMQKLSKPAFGSETISQRSTRGYYVFADSNDDYKYNDLQVTSYDMLKGAASTKIYTEWFYQDQLENFIGEFVWTGFDYLGEPSPYDILSIAKSSYFGIIDLANLKKDRFYLYKSRWNTKEPTLYLLPHWTHPSRVGKNVPVHCYTSYDKAELFVNGKSQGIREKFKGFDPKKMPERYCLMWNDVVYQPGEIKVVAYDKTGKIAAEQTVKTAGKPAKIKLTPNKQNIMIDGKDLVFVEVEITDKDGVLCPNAQNPIFFRVEGNGALAGVCNGNPVDHTPFSAQWLRAFNGKLGVILSSPSRESGLMTLRAITKDLPEAELKIMATPEQTE